MKKVNKILGVFIFITVHLFTACDWFDPYDYSFVLVHITEEYSKKYYDREFTLEDFKLKNAKDFFYYESPSSERARVISVRLINAGKELAQAAAKHLKKLDFVSRVEFSPNPTYGNGIHREYNGYCIDNVIIHISEIYAEKFNNKEFTLEDFKLDNAKDFSYYIDKVIYTDITQRWILLRLIETGKYYVHDAVRNLNQLEFCTSADLCEFTDYSHPYCRIISCAESGWCYFIE